MNHNVCDVPEPLAFLEFFGIEPVEARPEDAYWCYSFTDERGVELRFSVNAIEKSVQTIVIAHGEILSLCAHEGALRVWLTEANGRKSIEALCLHGLADSELVAEVTPQIAVRWSVLTKRG
jgi:hypothetical protein